MKRSRSSFLKWLLVGPITLIVGFTVGWLAVVTMTGRSEGFIIFIIAMLLGIFGLILTCVGWFDKLGLHKYVLSWMEK